MLKTWTVQNFKSVYDRTTLEMAPLTIFAGANNSGKSTLIQSILLTTQTLQSTVHSRSMILNGHVLRLGDFADIVSNNSDSENVSIGFKLQHDVLDYEPHYQRHYLYGPGRMIEGMKDLSCDFVFSSSGAIADMETLSLYPRIVESRFHVTAEVEGKKLEEEILIRKSSKTSEVRAAELGLTKQPLQPAELAAFEYEVVKDPPTSRRRRFFAFHKTGKSAGASLRHFLPERFATVFDSVDHSARQLTAAFTNPGEYPYQELAFENEEIPEVSVEFKQTILSVLKDCVESITVESDAKAEARSSAYTNLEANFTYKNLTRYYRTLLPVHRRMAIGRFLEKEANLIALARGNRPPKYSVAFTYLSEFSGAAMDYVSQFFSQKVKYLGPLRDEPKPVYPIAGVADTRDIGFRGEHTAAVLDVHKNTQIRFVSPTQIASGGANLELQKKSLHEAVFEWLQYMGVAETIETIDKGKLGHELKVGTSDNTTLHDLTHVGVGVSQVLPILVLSLLADQGSTLVFEQPELHLHPKVQTRLADFFVSMSYLNKQCIIETHSEYLINRLRYVTAVSEDSTIKDKVVMYFVEKSGTHSKYRQVKINQYGVIEDWPIGFFDEADENAAAILKAAIARRMKAKDSRHA